MAQTPEGPEGTGPGNSEMEIRSQAETEPTTETPSAALRKPPCEEERTTIGDYRIVRKLPIRF